MISEQSKVLNRIVYKGAEFILNSFEHIPGPFGYYRFSGYISGDSSTLNYAEIRIVFATLMDIMAVNTPFRDGNRLIMYKFSVTDITLQGVNSRTSLHGVHGEVSLQRIYFMNLIKSSRDLFVRSIDIPGLQVAP